MPRHIAILGGGLTGLSSAFHLSRRFPNARITLLEKQNRFGGWVRSEQVQLEPTASLTVEAGPRTLRPAGKSVLELINLLNLQSLLLKTPRSAPAAHSRFIYAPTIQPGLTSIPTTPLAFLRSPLRVLLPDILREPLRKSNRTATTSQSKNETYDESLDSFLSRRFGPELARVLGSALVHGIYAADARDLSVRAAFPSLYDIEDNGNGSVVLGILKMMMGIKKPIPKDNDYELGDVEALMQGIAVYSFQGGIQTLPNALVNALQSKPALELCSEEGVAGIEMRGQDGSFVVHTPKRTLSPSHIISALPLHSLQPILPSYAPALPHLGANPSSSVTVLSLIFAAPPHTIHPAGFGYLIPRPKDDYSPSALGILGTVFDSNALPIPPGADHAHEAKYTKLTVMLGGPYPGALPQDKTVLLAQVMDHLRSALQRDLPEPIASRVWRQDRCIPTLRVGHRQRMAELREVLEGRVWRGRMEVVGAGVDGLSVGDCVEAGRRVGARW